MIAQPQGLIVSHFDTKTGKPLNILETFNNTVAQYLFPDTTFSLGTVYDKTTPEELQRFSDKSLQFANGNKFYFADAPVRDQLFPTASDGAAYGSLPFTGCLNFTEVEKVRVLVIDDQTGKNGIGLDPKMAKKLVGDCWCRISPALHQQVGGQENTPFQFRMGIRPQESSPVARIAKGTLCPTDLSGLGDGYDLILATSAFKGRKGVDARAIAPGAYTLTLGLGIKSHAYYGTHSLGPQVLVNFPQGVTADILPRQQQALEKLDLLAQDQLALVEDYLNSTQERYKYRLLGELEVEGTLGTDDLDALMELVEHNNAEPIYHLLKQDSHRQLLEHPKVIAALNDHLQNRYRELATGRFVKFKGALLQPHADLTENEFCDSTLPDGEKVIVTRSPLVNSNGVITLTNRHLNDVTHLQGVAWINPKTAATYLQGDFDGDRVAYALACEYPTLAAEVEAKHSSDQRYADVVKKAKIPYTGSFEEIALSAKDNHIGIIAYQVMGAITLEQEISALPEPEKQPYLQQLSDYFASLWQLDKKTGERILPPSLDGKEELVTKLSTLAQSQATTEQKLEFIRQLLHDTVSQLGNELQVAVDGPKSALRPDEESLQSHKLLTAYREVSWLRDYKAKDVYRDRPLRSTNYSPVDLMVQPVNQVWQDYSLAPRPTHQFRGLFANVSYTSGDLDWAETVKTQYNRLNARAFRLKEEYTEAPGPRLILTSPTGNQLGVIHTLESNHPQTYDLSLMDIRIQRNDGKKVAHSDLKYMVTACVPGEINEKGQPLYKRLGYLSKLSELEHSQTLNRLIANSSYYQANFKGLQVEISPGVTPHQIQAAFAQVRAFAQDTLAQIPPDARLSKAAALWEVTHRRQNKLKDEQGEMKEAQNQRYNKASAVFALFTDEIASQLSQLQFQQFKVAGIATPANEYGTPPFDQPVPFLIDLQTHPYHPDYGSRCFCVEGQILGYLGEDEPQLPIGTTGQAILSGELAKTLTATLSNGQTLKVGLLKDYAYADTSFSSTSAQLEVTFVTAKGRQKPVPALRYQGQVVGEVRDSEAIALLQSQGLHRSGAKLRATLHRSVYATVAIAVVDPATVEYSEVFLTEKALLPKLEGKPKLRETLWVREKGIEEVALGQLEEKSFLRLAVDHRKLEALLAYLKENQLPYALATEQGEAGQEYRLGYSVVCLGRDSLPTTIEQALSRKFGAPLTWDDYQQRLVSLEANPPIEIPNSDRGAGSRPSIEPEASANNPQEEIGINTTNFKPTPDQQKALEQSAVICHQDKITLETLQLNSDRSSSEIASSINIASNATDPFGAALTNPTATANYYSQQSNGTQGCRRAYPVSFRDNSFRPATAKDDPYYRAEKYWHDKPQGVPFVSAEDAYKFSAKDLATQAEKEALMVEVITAKLTQYPELVQEIERRGGVQWLKTCSHQTKANNPNWEGTGHESGFIRALMEGYQQAQQVNASLKPDNPYLLVPYADQPNVEANRVKDRAMAALATQFIGFSAQTSSQQLSSTRDYYQCWHRYGLANTGNYTADDVVMVSGSGPWRGVTQRQINATFEQYKPLLEQAITSKAQFLVGNAAGTDRLVQQYLKERGYQFETTVEGYCQAKAMASNLSPSPSVESNGHQPVDPYLLQKQRTVIVAPIVRDYLTLAQTHRHQGNQYAATWDAQSQTLSLLDKSSANLKLVARQEKGQWHPQLIPLADPTQPNLTQADVEHFQALAPKITEKLAQRQQQYRAIYESARNFIQATHGAATSDIDVQVAISILNQTNDPQKAKQVLSESDTARHWQQSLSPEQYQQQLSAYLKQTFQSAQQLERSQQQQAAQSSRDFSR